LFATEHGLLELGEGVGVDASAGVGSPPPR
jgi:hypothetical protein